MRTLMKNKLTVIHYAASICILHSIRCYLIQPIAEETRQHASIFPPAYLAGDTTVYLFTDATSHSTHFQLFFGTCKTPCTEILNFFNGLRMRTPIHSLYFKNAQNRCKISGRKSELYWWQKNKTRFGIHRWNPLGDFR